MMIEEFIHEFLLRWFPAWIYGYITFLIIYFAAKYKLYKNRKFLLAVSILISGSILFYLIYPLNLVPLRRQRMRYLDIAINYVTYGLFGHYLYSISNFVPEHHLPFSAIPITAFYSIFGIFGAFKLTIWYIIYTIFVMILLIYSFYQIKEKERDASIFRTFLFILTIAPFIIYTAFDPYNYPEYSNILLFSVFLYLLYGKKDPDAFLILPLLLLSGNEYYLFFLAIPVFVWNFYKNDKLKDYICKSAKYLFVNIVVAFAGFYLSIKDWIFGSEGENLFKLFALKNTFLMFKRWYALYFPFFAFIPISFYLGYKYVKEHKYDKLVLVLFYNLAMIVFSTWGASYEDYLYEHFLPNLLPVIGILLSDVNLLIGVFLSAISVVLTSFDWKNLMWPYNWIKNDNLSLVDKVLKELPDNSTVVTPMGYDYWIIQMFSGKHNLQLYTFMDYPKIGLQNFYFFSTFSCKMTNFHQRDVCLQFFDVCEKIVEAGDYSLWYCKGDNMSIRNAISMYTSQHFG